MKKYLSLIYITTFVFLIFYPLYQMHKTEIATIARKDKEINTLWMYIQNRHFRVLHGTNSVEFNGGMVSGFLTLDFHCTNTTDRVTIRGGDWILTNDNAVLIIH